MDSPSFYKEDNNNSLSFIRNKLLLPRRLEKQWREKIGWLYSFPWRPEQLEILQSFQKEGWNKFIVQAVFGGGKTTMIIAMIFDLILHEKVSIHEIMICAFNVAIKNEIKKKLRHLGKIIPRTFDSLVWEICKEMNYNDLMKPNFLEKRRFLYENINRIPSSYDIKYIFLDEAQDLERNVEYIFFKRYPNAKFIIVGDIFQSIQKEPRESFLWSLLQKKLPNTFHMTNTPRVPKKILTEMKSALHTYYPEFQETIEEWESSNSLTMNDSRGIDWSMFYSYGDVFRKMENFVNHYGKENTMILVFSSAITVRGKLGDVSRVRRFFQEKKIPVNSNHKLMKDDSLFISTVNSSKGLEREHVFCFLTFPLELAFANFSNDILMNLLTVAMSRCKKSIHFCLPQSMDRFSPILRFYKNCPEPNLENKNKKSKEEKKEYLEEENFQYLPYLLEKEHSMTEIIRLQMLRFPTRDCITSYSKKYEDTIIPSSIPLKIRTEEESTIIGLIFETLILSLWKNVWPSFQSVDTIGHSMFDNFSLPIKKLYHEWNLFRRQFPYSTQSEERKIEGAILFSKLHLGYYQKIFVSVSSELKQSILHRWREIRGISLRLRPKVQGKIDIQHSVRLPFMNGIIDVFYCPENEMMEIFEIKASKTREWKENALLQSILYGLCKKRKIFRVHLINVFSTKWSHYCIHFKDDLEMVLSQIRDDLQLYNLNCFLSKNGTIRNPIKKDFPIENVFFLDGIPEKELYFYEFTSPTKITLLFRILTKENIESFWKSTFPSLQKNIKIKKIVVSRLLWKDRIPLSVLSLSDFRFLNKKNEPYTSKEWETFLHQCNWYKDKELIKGNQEDDKRQYTQLKWKNILSTSSVQIGDLCKNFNFII